MTDARTMRMELRGRLCRCGSPKQQGHSFCRACFSTLNRNARAALYRRFGQGYEAAYEHAVRKLAEAGRMAMPKALDDPPAESPPSVDDPMHTDREPPS